MTPRGAALYAAAGIATVAGVRLTMSSPVLGALVVVAAAAIVLLMAWGPDGFGARVMVLAFFLSPMVDLRPLATSKELTFADVALVVGAAALLPRLLVHRSRTPTLLAVGGLFLFMMVLASSLMAQVPVFSITVGLRLVGAAILLPLLFCFWQPGRDTLRRLAGAYVLGQTVSLVVALLSGPVANGRYQGLTYHSNFFAVGGLFAVALCPYLFTTSKHRHRWIWVALGLAAASSVYISGSRGALLAVLALAIAYPLLERSTFTGYLLVTSTFLALPFLRVVADRAGPGSALGRLLGKSDTVDNSDEARREALQFGWDRFLHSPFWGNGFEENLEIHNIFLQVLAAVGIIGFVAWGMIMLSLLLPLFGKGEHRLLAYATLAYLGIGLTEPMIWERIAWLPVSLAVVGAITATRDTPSGQEAAPATATGAWKH